MGQGRYFCIGYGATLDDVSERGQRELAALRMVSFGPYSDSTSEPGGAWGPVYPSFEEEAAPYLAIQLAVSDPACVNSRLCIAIADLEAIPLDEVVTQWRVAIGPERLAAAEVFWRHVQEDALRQAQIALPAGRMLFITDWD